MTASQLFAKYSPSGDERCYYCGGACGTEHTAKNYVKPTFTNRDIVAYPSSPYVCHGCMESLRSDLPLIRMIDGVERGPDATKTDNVKPQRVRMYSWIVTESGPIAATKAHITRLREVVLSPPDPPFVIVLATSGQKNLLFRAPVAWDRYRYPLLLEEETIDVNVDELRDRLALVTQVVAVVGKPGAVADTTIGQAIQFDKHYGNLDVFDAWEAVKPHPISRLAAWLAPNKESAKNEYPGIERGELPAKTRRTGRRAEKAPGNGTSGSEGHVDQVRFDFGESVQ